MSLLFDQNISFRLLKKIKDFYPNAKQVKELGLENASDIEIFDFAKNNDFTIVTLTLTFLI